MTITVGQAQMLLEERGNQAVRALALEVLKRIVLRTPVDTGRARGNWNIGLGSPDRSNGSGPDKGGNGTIARGMALLAGTEGQTVFITNSLPYILPLEHGSSKQSPAGMVAVTLAELQPLANQIAAELNA